MSGTRGRPERRARRIIPPATFRTRPEREVGGAAETAAPTAGVVPGAFRRAAESRVPDRGRNGARCEDRPVRRHAARAGSLKDGPAGGNRELPGRRAAAPMAGR